MSINQFEIWIADLNPRMGSESGKTRPVLIVQTNLLNKVNHPTTLICPLTTNTKIDAVPLRVSIRKGTAGLNQNCDIMIDQIRAIDNRRLIKKMGDLPYSFSDQVKLKLYDILDLFL